MTEELENKTLEVGDIISLDDEEGEALGDYEVIARFALNNKEYVALTPALDEEPAGDEELEIFLLGLENEELTALEEAEEEAAYAKLTELLDDIEFVEEEK